jgi:hypothetical protein
MKSRLPGNKRRFVSPSVRQHQRKQAMSVDSTGIVNNALRDLDAGSIAWPAALKPESRVPTSCDDLCAAYWREATGAALLRDRVVQTEDHALIVVCDGDLVIESVQGPSAVKQGDSAFVAAGWCRLTELPVAHGAVSYWIIFFSPALLQMAIGDQETLRQAAAQVVPAFSGVYIQRGLLRVLKFHGCDGPVPDVEKTIRVIGAMAGASFFMFLRAHYYARRDALQRLVRVCLSSRCALEQIGTGWPGGPSGFRREFKLYHGISVRAWVRGWRQ